jgi:RNA polymerase sigma-70 factor (ECF subfamily)
MEPALDEAEVLKRARGKDREAITQIVVSHQDMVRSYLARYAPDPATADDLAQEVFLVALKSFDRVDPALGIRPYLMGIARNLSRSAWRKRLPDKVLSQDVIDTIAAPAPESEAARPGEDRLTILRECLERLAPKARGVIDRHYSHNESCEEIGRALGLALGSVRSILTRARKALLDCMRPKLEGSR